MSVKHIQDLIKEKHIKFIDLRFTDTRGKEQHVTICPRNDQEIEHFVNHGKPFDGSSITKFKNRRLL